MQPEVEGRILMTAAKPLARYGAIEERARERLLATAELHNLWRRDPANRPWTHSLSGGAMGSDGWVRQLPDAIVSVLSRKL